MPETGKAVMMLPPGPVMMQMAVAGLFILSKPMDWPALRMRCRLAEPGMEAVAVSAASLMRASIPGTLI